MQFDHLIICLLGNCIILLPIFGSLAFHEFLIFLFDVLYFALLRIMYLTELNLQHEKQSIAYLDFFIFKQLMSFVFGFLCIENVSCYFPSIFLSLFFNQLFFLFLIALFPKSFVQFFVPLMIFLTTSRSINIIFSNSQIKRNIKLLVNDQSLNLYIDFITLKNMKFSCCYFILFKSISHV